MNGKLVEAAREEIETIRNLMQFYFYDFSEFNRADAFNDGKFREYPCLDHYWREEGRFSMI
ncbi:hypothetical protein FZC84_07345 [Rossellomorea vietnamensis]|uniref:Uncharacterized protein n=1 Tax=Rossellomorea vietnamensis TaxID=218284 RepID=A0A5D4MFR9_9BACI|nr:hypothetical protein [Rossellomorea vietnamensis]TYS00348.1 hypothetical protein FZC84_07345 [Rossellomorea vietnamensis]